ncbi:chitinase-3-like protein 1 [Elysia marginata]|uniref:Chitinase-3-like protein 1 n=1 Tax=Elysia marginata TaxID=1093978 RepID=A0AAV4IN43_9GAST|nr:chitinase-3-like protein 1 [Elysia marginata]
MIPSAVDYVCLMAYDFYGHWEGFTGHMTALYAPDGAEGIHKTHNVNSAVTYWLDGGCPRDKLVLGLAAYGRSFTLEYESDTGLGALTRGPGAPGPQTGEAGTLAIYEICAAIRQGGEVVWLDQQKVPYFVRGNQWVAFDDLRSMDLKVKYIEENRLAGAMLWDATLDDFRGSNCQIGPFPLLTAINKAMRTKQGDI